MTITLSDTVFNADYNEGLIHQVVTAYLNQARSGNSAQKTRSEVRGGGAKPWRQKGTGRARAGTSRSPLWRSGGVTFASKKRDYSQKTNKKMYCVAMRSILSELKRQDRLVIVKDIKVDEPKTSKFIEILKKNNISRGLIVVEALEKNLFLSARNINNIFVVDVAHMDPVSLVGAEKVLISEAAIKQLEELFG